MAWGGRILWAQGALAPSEPCNRVQSHGALGRRAPRRRAQPRISSSSFQQLARARGNAPRCCRLGATTFRSTLHCLRATGKAQGSPEPGKRFPPTPPDPPCERAVLLCSLSRSLGHRVRGWSDAQHWLLRHRAGEHRSWLPQQPPSPPNRDSRALPLGFASALLKHSSARQRSRVRQRSRGALGWWGGFTRSSGSPLAQPLQGTEHKAGQWVKPSV